MKASTLVRIYALFLLVIFGGIVLHAPFIVGMETQFPELDLLAKSWKEILMVPATAIAVYLVWQQNSWRELARDRLLQVIGVYALLHILTAAALLAGPLATLAGLAIDMRYIVFFVLVYILLKLEPNYKGRFLQVAAVGATVVVGFGVLQLFLPADILTHIGYSEQTIQPYLTVDKNPDYVRINSTLRGPNPLGAYVVIVLSLLAAAVLRGKLDVRKPKNTLLVGGATLSSLVVLWVSYSRSAVAAAGIAIGIVTLLSVRHLIPRKLWIAGFVVAFAAMGGIVAGRDHQFVSNVILHENREAGSDVSSNDDHVASLADGTERMLRQPIGAGIGSTGSASLLTDEPNIIENQYLFIAHEVGWFGLGIFITLLSLLLRRLWQQRKDWLSLGVLASGAGLSLIGLLLPVWADDTVAIIWWGLAAVAIASGGKYVRKKSHKKSA